MDGVRHHITMSRTVASKLIGHESPGRLALLLEKPAKESGCSFRISPGLNQDIQYLAILIHGPI